MAQRLHLDCQQDFLHDVEGRCIAQVKRVGLTHFDVQGCFGTADWQKFLDSAAAGGEDETPLPRSQSLEVPKLQKAWNSQQLCFFEVELLGSSFETCFFLNPLNKNMLGCLLGSLRFSRPCSVSGWSLKAENLKKSVGWSSIGSKVSTKINLEAIKIDPTAIAPVWKKMQAADAAVRSSSFWWLCIYAGHEQSRVASPRYGFLSWLFPILVSSLVFRCFPPVLGMFKNLTKNQTKFKNCLKHSLKPFAIILLWIGMFKNWNKKGQTNNIFHLSQLLKAWQTVFPGRRQFLHLVMTLFCGGLQRRCEAYMGPGDLEILFSSERSGNNLEVQKKMRRFCVLEYVC